MRRILATVVVLALCACTKTGDAGTANSWTRHGVLRWSTSSDPKSLNPLIAASTVVGDLSMFIYSYAVRYDQHSQPVPDAVREIPTIANGDVSRDGLTLKYKLRPNMLWHDGEKVTCKDLRFTWQAVMNPHNNVVATDGYKDIRDIDCRDPLVAVVHMKRIYAPYLQQLWGVNGNAPILPEHLLAKYNDALGSMNSVPYNALPVGSGPFKVVRWDRGTQVVMKAFPQFYLGKPKLDEVIFHVMPDTNTEMMQLRTHEIDMITHGSVGLWSQYLAIQGVVAEADPIFTYDHIDFNLRRPIVNELAVRRALAYATDRRTMLQKLAHGLGLLSPADQSPKLSWAYTPDVTMYPFDPAKAEALLDAAGWKRGPDGIRARGGVRLSFAFNTQTESRLGQATGQFLQDAWRHVGVELTIKTTQTALFFENSATGVLQGGRYDIASFAWSAAADPDDSAIYSGHNFAPHGQNALFWDDKVATKAMDDALATVDETRRKAAYKIVQQRLTADVPTIVMWFRDEPQVYNKDLKGFTCSPVISCFWDPWEYSI